MSNAFKQGINAREWLKGLLSLQDPGGGGRLTSRAELDTKGEFPPAGIDYIHHEVRVVINIENPAPGEPKEEVLELQGAMFIQRSDPYTNPETGRRQIDFKVRSWAASAWSNSLKGVVSYVLTEGEQPVSQIVAQEPGADFPADFNFKLLFDVRFNNVGVFERNLGEPICETYMVIPPNGDRQLCPTATTFRDPQKVQMVHPVLGNIVATPLTCNDQDHSRTIISLPGTPLEPKDPSAAKK